MSSSVRLATLFPQRNLTLSFGFLLLMGSAMVCSDIPLVRPRDTNHGQQMIGLSMRPKHTPQQSSIIFLPHQRQLQLHLQLFQPHPRTINKSSIFPFRLHSHSRTRTSMSSSSASHHHLRQGHTETLFPKQRGHSNQAGIWR